MFILVFFDVEQFVFLILKFNETSMENIFNQSNIEHKWTKHRSKIAKNRGLEGSGAGLEASWAVLGDLGRSKASLEASWTVLEASWRRPGEVLEASWAVLGRERWPTWLQLGSQNGAKNEVKIDPKIDQIFNASWNRLLEGFWWILDAKMKQS